MNSFCLIMSCNVLTSPAQSRVNGKNYQPSSAHQLLTFPWLPLLVATKGSSATSQPNTRRIPADTMDELQCKQKRLLSYLKVRQLKRLDHREDKLLLDHQYCTVHSPQIPGPSHSSEEVFQVNTKRVKDWTTMA